MRTNINLIPLNPDWQPSTVSFLMARYGASPSDITGFVDKFFDEACPKAIQLRQAREREERKAALLAEKRRLDELLAEMGEGQEWKEVFGDEAELPRADESVKP